MPKTPRQPPLARLDRPLSLVAQVEQSLRRALAERAFPDGRLPTEVELAERFGVSRETVRRAAEVLQREGLLRKFRRRGTVVRSQSPEVAWPESQASSILAYVQAEYRSPAGLAEGVGTGASALLLQGAMAEAGESGFDLILRTTAPDALRKTVEQLSARYRIRGVIAASFAEDKALRRLTGRELPIVLLDHDLHVPKTSSIRDDSAAGGRLAVEHLTSLGHRRIAYAHWHQADLNPWRPRGYREALRAARIAVRRDLEVAAEIIPAGAAALVERLLSLAAPPTAVVCFNNTLARLVIDAFRQRGVRVPESMSVVGCGGEEVVGLTSCQSDWHQMGRRAMKMLLRRLQAAAPSATIEHEQIAPSLCSGDTTSPPRKAATP